MKQGTKHILQLFFSWLIAAGVPCFFAAWLNVLGSPLALLLLPVSGVSLLNYTRVTAGGWIKRTAAVIHTACYAAGAVIIFIYIIVIPFPLYQAWTSLVKTGAPSGSISFLFVTGVAWFSALFAGCLFHSGWVRPLAGLAAVILFLVTVIYREMWLCLLTLLAFLTNAALLALYQWKFRFAALRVIILPAGVSLVLAIFLSAFQGNTPGFLSYYSLSPSVRNVLESAFPALGALSLSPGYDDSRDTARLGGRAFISKWPVFAVQAEQGRTLYLRMKVYDQYNGDSWETSSSLIDAVRNESENHQPPAALEPGVRITQLLDYSLLVPHTLATAYFSLEPELPGLFAYGSKATGFLGKLPLVKDTVIRLYEQPALPAAPGPVQESILTHYRQLPGTLPDALHKLAAQWSGSPVPAGVLAERITQYLERTCVYSLDAGYPPTGRDFTADFLFTQKKGYCVHFATAAAVLFRLCGIPSRYVKGYYARIPPGSDTTICTGLSSHAWTEIFVEDSGWRIVEATPPLDPANLSNARYAELFNPGHDPLLDLQLTYLATGALPGKPAGGKSRVPVYVLIALAAALAVTGALLVYRALKRRTRQVIRYRGCKREIQLVLEKLVKQGADRGIPHPRVTGWAAWWEAWQTGHPVKVRYVHRALAISSRVLFGPEPGRSLDAKFLRCFCRKKPRIL